MFLEVSQNSQENTCARASFLIKLQAFEFCELSKGLVTHNHILKIYRIIQYSKNVFKCNMVKNILKIYKKITFLLKKVISLELIKSNQFDYIHYTEIIFLSKTE